MLLYIAGKYLENHAINIKKWINSIPYLLTNNLIIHSPHWYLILWPLWREAGIKIKSGRAAQWPLINSLIREKGCFILITVLNKSWWRLSIDWLSFSVASTWSDIIQSKRRYFAVFFFFLVLRLLVDFSFFKTNPNWRTWKYKDRLCGKLMIWPRVHLTLTLKLKTPSCCCSLLLDWTLNVQVMRLGFFVHGTSLGKVFVYNHNL